MAAVHIRSASAADAPAIAALHADSWRRHYRGAYSDAYLDGDVEADRLAVWTDRLATPRADFVTLVAEGAGGLVGFVHAALDADPTWGTLIDNLHVRHAQQRTGLGTILLRAAAATVLRPRPDSSIYLWVLEQNTAAQAFYGARGGRFQGDEPVDPPGGDPRNLDGPQRKIRVVWPDAAMLVDRPA